MPTFGQEKVDALITMLKGEPGTRKSTAALSWPLPQFWVNTDRKMNALRIPAKNWGLDVSKIQYESFSGIDAQRNWIALENKLNSFRLNCPFKNGSLIADSITSHGDVINLQVIELTAGQKNAKGENKGMVIGGIDVNDWSHYKAEASGFQNYLAILQDIKQFHNVNIVLIAHVIGERKPEERGITHHARTIITGGKNISGKISAYCEEAYHFNVKANPDPQKEGFYSIITQHTGEDYARTMLPLPREIQFNDKPLYPTFIKPAIDKLNQG